MYGAMNDRSSFVLGAFVGGRVGQSLCASTLVSLKLMSVTLIVRPWRGPLRTLRGCGNIIQSLQYTQFGGHQSSSRHQEAELRADRFFGIVLIITVIVVMCQI